MKVHCVIVTFNPNINLFKKSVESLICQVDDILIIDNTVGNKDNLNIFSSSKISVKYLRCNIGIAGAQNIGINHAIDGGSDYILLSDQDTVYPPDYISKMCEIFDFKQKVAATCPDVFDVYQNKRQGFVKKTWFGFKKIYPKKGCHEIYHAINSGQILNVKHLKDIGLMNQDLFIDWVDYEWCWRACGKGFKIIGNSDMLIRHQLGEGAVNLSFTQVSLKSPIRYYYITRNAFYLSLRCKHLNSIHKLNLFSNSFRYIFGYPILSKYHFLSLRYVFLGFYHGIIGKLGRLN